MNEIVINELFEQLKSNLKEVESAQKQVNDIIKAYKSLEKPTKEYANELGKIKNNVEILVSQIEEIKNKFLANVSTEIIKEIQISTKDTNSNINKSSSEIKTIIDNSENIKLNCINQKSIEIQKLLLEIKRCNDNISTDISNLNKVVNTIFTDISKNITINRWIIIIGIIIIVALHFIKL